LRPKTVEPAAAEKGVNNSALFFVLPVITRGFQMQISASRPLRLWLGVVIAILTFLVRYVIPAAVPEATV
jgi:hypothetical protein